MILKQNVLVVDLDGTLYSVNTFHHFLKFIVTKAITKFRPVTTFKIVFFIGLRFLRVVSHSRLKYWILKYLNTVDFLDYNEFVKSLEQYKNDIKELHFPYKIKVLATAAPAIYADKIAEEHNFKCSIATEFLNVPYHQDFESKKHIKKRKVMSYLKSINYSSIDLCITDHKDDLPLVKKSTNTILINPKKEFVELLRKQNVNFEIRNIKR